MDYTKLWKVLEALYNELIKRGVILPREFMDDLKSAKTLINIYKVDTSTVNVATEIEVYLEKIESTLLYLAESDIGKEYAEKWLQRVYEARREGLTTKTTRPSKFVAGVPKNEHWIRIKTSDLISNQELEALLEKYKLSSKSQKDEYRLIHGSEKNVQNFLKEIGKKIRKKR